MFEACTRDSSAVLVDAAGYAILRRLGLRSGGHVARFRVICRAGNTHSRARISFGTTAAAGILDQPLTTWKCWRQQALERAIHRVLKASFLELRCDCMSESWDSGDFFASGKGKTAAPSQFRVGAALRATSVRIFGGVNVENATYGLTVCAERIAIFKGSAKASALRRISRGNRHRNVDASLRHLPPA